MPHAKTEPAPLFSLEGRTAFVTGASRGIGRALAIGLADAGADLVIGARTASGLEETAAAIRDRDRTCLSLPLDVTSADSRAAAFDMLQENRMRPDILVNNAGMEEVRPATDIDEALWDRILDTNLKGAFFMARDFARQLMEAPAPGAIVNVCSLTSAVGVPTAVPYTASKSGLLGMTRALACEWAPDKIRVNGIGPGYFHTELTDGFYKSADWRAAMRARIPMDRFGELDDLVGACVFLASDAARYITGQLLYVDGGYMASI
jgi:gluconate 5-dehydrogenase